MTRPAADAYDAVFDALAHPARRRILTSLNFAEGQMTAGAIAALATSLPGGGRGGGSATNTSGPVRTR